MSPVETEWLHDEANSPHVSERMHAAANPATPKEDLARLIDDEHPGVRQVVMRNPAARNLTPHTR